MSIFLKHITALLLAATLGLNARAVQLDPAVDLILYQNQKIGDALDPNRYTNKKLLSTHGGSSTVYEIFDERTNRLLILKAGKANVAETMKKEIYFLQVPAGHDEKGTSLLVKMLDNFVYKSHVCIVLEKLDKDMIEVSDIWMRQYNQLLPMDSLKTVLYEISTAIKSLHDIGLIHRDLKPENIMYADAKIDKINGIPIMKNLVVKITDFGTVVGNNEHNIQWYMITPEYTAPEVLTGGKSSFPVDIWALAAIAYYCYTGRILFHVPNNGNGNYNHYENEKKLVLAQMMILRPSIEAHLLHVLPPSYLRDHNFGTDLNEMKKLHEMLEDTNRVIDYEDLLYFDLLEQILVADPNMRLTIDGVLNHPFFDSIRNQESPFQGHTEDDIVLEGDKINFGDKTFEVGELLNDGPSGKVFGIVNVPVVVKVAKYGQRYEMAAKREIRNLGFIEKSQSHHPGKKLCAEMKTFGTFRGRDCIVFHKQEGKSVAVALHESKGLPFPTTVTKHLMYQLCAAGYYLHTELHMVHTNINPKTVFLANPTYNPTIDAEYRQFLNTVLAHLSPVKQSRISNLLHEAKVRQLMKADVQLNDFSDAVIETSNDFDKYRDYHVTNINSMAYRAPEVVFGEKWSYKVDVWAIGCILVELNTGQPLFDMNHRVHSAKQIYEAVVEHVLETKIPSEMKSGMVNDNGFHHDTSNIRTLRRLTSGIEDNSLHDLATKMLHPDPEKRISLYGALTHRYFASSPTFNPPFNLNLQAH